MVLDKKRVELAYSCKSLISLLKYVSGVILSAIKFRNVSCTNTASSLRKHPFVIAAWALWEASAKICNCHLWSNENLTPQYSREASPPPHLPR